MNNGKICISVAAETADEMIAKIKQAEQLADVIEVRFDSLRPDELLRAREIVDSTTKPKISTFRPLTQGGFRELSESERDAFWCSGLGTALCDVEEEFVEVTKAWPWGERICSYHDFDGVPADLESKVACLKETEAEKIKVALTANDITDSISVWNVLTGSKPHSTIPVAMGDAGKWTRILGLAHGAFLTYASLESGDETAPGQVSANDLIEVYRVKEFDKDTKVFGVIGNPISQSMSPYMHNPAFVELGVNAVFIPFLVKNIDEFIRRMVKPETREVELNFGGFSVTMPHKQSIIPHLDAIDEVAKAIGAVNTVRIDDNGKLTGYNTDAHGFITPLKAKYGDLRDANVAVFGAGGAARAVVYALKQEGANVTVFARDAAKGSAFADEFGVTFAQPVHFEADFDVVVNATPLGMKAPLENDSIVTADDLMNAKLVFDLVTKPFDTPLIAEAIKAGASTIGGIEMLVAQGAKQFEIWTGKPGPAELMMETLRSRM
ncbi:MAG TPA: shikimate dehydrogenase [Pyrinomonadaceae bacterium]|nr:shikimate dehydrogenase [Pyrinomonadaceae bacterium]